LPFAQFDDPATMRLVGIMPGLRLTSKLLAEVGAEHASDVAGKPSPLGDWYGHVFTIERRKSLIFINEPTLFVCLIVGVVRADYRPILTCFKTALGATLSIMQFSEREVQWVMSQHDEMQIGRATNRTMMGCLVNRVSDARFRVAAEGGLDLCNIDAVTIELNRTPMKPIRYGNGLEWMRRAVAQGMP
jgi:uncharacterized protein DUF6933